MLRPDQSCEQALASLATAQRGVVSRDQLLGLGFSQRTIETRCGRGMLHRIAPGTYAVGHRGLSRRALGIAALLHTGPESALSHWTALRIWGLVESDGSGDIHVSVTNRSPFAVQPPIVLHRPRTLEPHMTTVHRNLRVTTPERALTEVLPSLRVPATTRILEQMVTRLDRSPDDLHAWAGVLGPVSGKTTLLRALEEIVGPVVLRSRLEDEFRSLCQDHCLPLPRTNYRIGRWEVDAVWPDECVALELDSWAYHGGRWQFHRDRRKGLDVSRGGFELLRMSWPQVKYARADSAQAIALALDRGRVRVSRLVPT